MPNINNALNALRQEERQLSTSLDKIRSAISALTDGSVSPVGGRRIGQATRKAKKKARSMTAAQRKAVSRRMKAYWAGRRKSA